MVDERKVRLVNRAIVIGGGALMLAVFAYLLATGSPLAGTLLAGGAGCVLGYGLIHLAAGRLVSPRALRARLVRTVVLALVVVLAMTAKAFVDFEYSVADSTPDLLVNGFFYGVAFAAVMRLFGLSERANTE